MTRPVCQLRRPPRGAAPRPTPGSPSPACTICCAHRPGCRSPRPMQASAGARSTSCAHCAGWPPISAPACWCMARPISARSSPAKRTTGASAAIDCFAAVAEAAAQARVVYCIEPLSRQQTQFINTVEEAAAIVRAIDSPAVRTMIDCSAAGQAEAVPVADLVRRWVPTGLIGHIHFNDPNRRGPGEGTMAFAPILAALAATKYPGDAAIEPFIYEPDGPTCAARQIGYLRGLIEAGNA